MPTTVSRVSAKLQTHEAVCAERWKETITRIKRLEHIMIGAAGTIIILLATPSVPEALPAGLPRLNQLRRRVFRSVDNGAREIGAREKYNHRVPGRPWISDGRIQLVGPQAFELRDLDANAAIGSCPRNDSPRQGIATVGRVS